MEGKSTTTLDLFRSGAYYCSAPLLFMHTHTHARTFSEHRPLLFASSSFSFLSMSAISIARWFHPISGILFIASSPHTFLFYYCSPGFHIIRFQPFYGSTTEVMRGALIPTNICTCTHTHSRNRIKCIKITCTMEKRARSNECASAPRIHCGCCVVNHHVRIGHNHATGNNNNKHEKNRIINFPNGISVGSCYYCSCSFFFFYFSIWLSSDPNGECFDLMRHTYNIPASNPNEKRRCLGKRSFSNFRFTFYCTDICVTHTRASRALSIRR